jgi:hypothetical protein
MKTNLMNSALIASMALTLSACVVAPPQPIGYRMTSSVLPTYVNGQYVGMQPSNYAPPAQAVVTTPAPVQAPVAQAPQAAPVYLQSTSPSVVYVQAPTPVYSYDPYYPPAYYPYSYPYYSPFFLNPWFGGVSIGIGIGGHGHGHGH